MNSIQSILISSILSILKMFVKTSFCKRPIYTTESLIRGKRGDLDNDLIHASIIYQIAWIR